MLKITSKIKLDKSVIESPNITDQFTPEELDAIGEYCWQGWQADSQSRGPWLRRTEAAMNLAMQIEKEKTFPWPGASNVIFPLISIAALNFSARAYGSIISAPELVHYIILSGNVDQAVADQAIRLGQHMSFQLLEQDTSWEEQHDRLFINLAIVGINFIKSKYDTIKRHNIGELVLARDLVVNYWSKDLASSPRITQEFEMSRNDLVSAIRSDSMRDVTDEAWFKQPPPIVPNSSTEKDNRRGTDPEFVPDYDTPFQLLEQHRDIDLDCDGYAEPWIITFDRFSKKVLRIVLNCDREEDIERNDDKEIIKVKKTEYYTKYSFIPAPDGGFYDVGFGVLMGPLNEGVNTAINQLFDAGTIANLGGGFLGRGAKLRNGQMAWKPGEWKNIDSTGDDLRKSMVPVPAPEPSTVLFQLLGLLIEYTNQLAGSTDAVLAKNPGQNTPAETSRNMMESGLQIYSTIFKRIWRSMKEEFKKYHVLNAKYLPTTTTFGHGKSVIRREDYLTNPDWARPAADPNTISAAQRLNQAMLVREAAMTSNGGYNMEEVERNYLKSLRVQNLDTIFPGFEAVPPGEDPKMQIEKMKAEIEAKDQQLEQWKFIKEWQEAIRLNSAKIQLLEAQAAGIFADIEESKAASARESYNAFISGLYDHNEMLNERVRTTLEVLDRQLERQNGGGKSGKSGGKAGKKSSDGVRSTARVSAGGSSQPSVRQMAGGDAGPVGFGLPGGFKA